MINRECTCCRDFLHHCEKCWDKHHNGVKHKDYIAPKYFGESIMTDSIIKEMTGFADAFGLPNLIPNPTIKPNKKKKYKEGEYH